MSIAAKFPGFWVPTARAKPPPLQNDRQTLATIRRARISISGIPHKKDFKKAVSLTLRHNRKPQKCISAYDGDGKTSNITLRFTAIKLATSKLWMRSGWSKWKTAYLRKSKKRYSLGMRQRIRHSRLKLAAVIPECLSWTKPGQRG